ncbi:MAG: helix-turn-helix transcriptional regulator [Peptococcaceae bacterium]|jgi:transcriptional regulator with XRE-family HTH domain|nr:helix-turn-helix transcriptional regulator [Peptococcaceae bacterium]
MSIGKRLEELINYRNTNVNRVAREAGISPQTIYGIIKRDNTKVDINILMALAKELNVTLDFFSGGPLNVDEVDVETFVSRYRQLDAHGKKVVQSLITLELERIEEEKAE